MEGINEKIVRFDEFCKNCVNYNLDESESPCNECLSTPARPGTRKPEKFKEKDNASRK